MWLYVKLISILKTKFVKKKSWQNLPWSSELKDSIALSVRVIDFESPSWRSIFVLPHHIDQNPQNALWRITTLKRCFEVRAGTVWGSSIIWGNPHQSNKEEDTYLSSIQVSLKKYCCNGQASRNGVGCFLRVRWLLSGVDNEMALLLVTRCRKGANLHLFPVDKQKVHNLVKSCYFKESRHIIGL